MRSFFYNLLLLAGLACLMAVCVAPGLIAHLGFHLRSPWPVLVSGGWMWLLYLAFSKWLAASRQKESTPVSISHDSQLGQIKHFKDRWDAAVQIPGVANQVGVSGDTPAITANQRKTLQAIIAGHSDFARQFIRGCNEENFDNPGVILTEEALQLDAIDLDDSAEGSFSLLYEVPTHNDRIAWGLEVDFEDYVFISASCPH